MRTLLAGWQTLLLVLVAIGSFSGFLWASRRSRKDNGEGAGPPDAG